MLRVDKGFGLGVAVGGDRASLEGNAFGNCFICLTTPAEVGGGAEWRARQRRRHCVMFRQSSPIQWGVRSFNAAFDDFLLLM